MGFECPVGAELGQINDSSQSDDDIVVVPDAEVERSSEPPVVARLVVEIRSDGSRTIARGALEDRATGQNVAIEARGDSPMSLALSLLSCRSIP